MENYNQEQGAKQQTINIQVPTVESISSKRSLIPILFAMVIVFFFFNFFTISCGEQKVGSVSGINLVTGTELKKHDMFSGKETKGEEIPSSIWAIIAFSAAIVGLGVFLIKEKREALIGTGAGAIGFGSLIILQFAIKSAIEEKGEGAIHVDYEFAYWGALVAMGMAGIISYLRMQKTTKIVVSTSQPISSTTTDTNNEIKFQSSNSLVEQPSNFDLALWLGKNKKMLIVFASIIIVFWGVYHFFIKHDPINDAKAIIDDRCDCEKQYNAEMIETDKEFIKMFDSYRFKTRQDARNKLEELHNQLSVKYSNCNDLVQQELDKKRSRYIVDKELLDKFDFAYSSLEGTCKSTSQTELTTLSSEIEKKILSIKRSEPDIEKIKHDLLGRNVQINAFSSWHFDSLDEFNKITIISSNDFGTNLEIDIHMDLRDSKTNERWATLLVVTYSLINDDWVFQSVREMEVADPDEVVVDTVVEPGC